MHPQQIYSPHWLARRLGLLRSDQSTANCIFSRGVYFPISRLYSKALIPSPLVLICPYTSMISFLIRPMDRIQHTATAPGQWHPVTPRLFHFDQRLYPCFATESFPSFLTLSEYGNVLAWSKKWSEKMWLVQLLFSDHLPSHPSTVNLPGAVCRPP